MAPTKNGAKWMGAVAAMGVGTVTAYYYLFLRKNKRSERHCPSLETEEDSDTPVDISATKVLESAQDQDSGWEEGTTQKKPHLCPRGHIMENEVTKDECWICDVCHSSLTVGQEMLVCKLCLGYTVCYDCKDKSQEPNPYTTYVDHKELGEELFEKGNFAAAVQPYQKSLDIWESLMEENSAFPSWHNYIAARSAELLAKSQYLAGDADAALRTCEKAMSYYQASGEEYKGGVAFMEQLLTDMKHLLVLQEPTNKEPPQNQSNNELLLGVSVHHLQTTFLAHVRIANLSEQSNIHTIENLQGPPGVMRRRGANVICPIDGKMGAAYVNCLEGEDHVGEATHMLSYSWSYKIGDIVCSLSDYCTAHNRDPKRTYIWICCLCINQHRVVEAKEKGESGLMNFEEEFPRKLKKIGHMLAMMAPWQAPFYLTRLWCVFEMYAAHANDCKVDIVMPPQEKESLEHDVINEDGGINALYEALGNTDVQNADATVQTDKEVIMKMIESTVGCQMLNNKVNELLRSWMKQVLVELVEKREDTNDVNYASYCFRIGQILEANGEHDGALEQYRKCLAIDESVLGTDHPHTATTHNNIGSALCNKGDYDGALEQYRKCLAINESVLGTDHPCTATTYNNIGLALDYKGDYDGALEQYRKCLVVRESVLGTDHPSTATTYNSIGSALRNKDDYDGALEQYRKCLVVRESVLGTDHPSTARTHNNIGSVLDDKGVGHVCV